ncbi:MAG: FKBP-type peptidyl-prolyl cis-trans isomerase [Caldilineaceae bacterium]
MIRKQGLLLATALMLLIVTACGPEQPSTASSAAAQGNTVQSTTAQTSAENTTQNTTQNTEGSIVTTASGLQYQELQAGTGPAPQPGDIVSVHYTGKLTDGTKFDSSLDRGQPFQFPLGAGRVIKGWDEGIALMKKGGKAILTIPPELGYGARGAGGVIPPNATLVFEVELVDILPGAPAAPQAVNEGDYQTTATGLKYYDFVVGTGAAPAKGKQVVVHYTGWLVNGKKFDSSLDRGEPFSFTIGMGQVIRGWDEGVMSMKVGGKRQLKIPPELAYGPGGAGGVIPGNATLIFEVELLDVR